MPKDEVGSPLPLSPTPPPPETPHAFGSRGVTTSTASTRCCWLCALRSGSSSASGSRPTRGPALCSRRLAAWRLKHAGPLRARLVLSQNGCGSKNRYQNGSLVSGNMGQNLRNPSCLILSHTQMGFEPQMASELLFPKKQTSNRGRLQHHCGRVWLLEGEALLVCFHCFLAFTGFALHPPPVLKTLVRNQGRLKLPWCTCGWVSSWIHTELAPRKRDRLKPLEMD